MVSALLLPLALAGFLLSWYILHKKNKKQNLVCVIGKDCNKVINSKYSKIFGFDNTIAGMLYYVSMIVAAGLSYMGISSIVGISLNLLVILASVGAALMGAVLTYIQLAILKEWCEYCLLSAGISILILIVELMAF